MDEETAWACFMRTGSVRDYLVYSQSKRSGRAKQAARQTEQEETDAVQYGGPCSQRYVCG